MAIIFLNPVFDPIILKNHIYPRIAILRRKKRRR